MSSRAILYKDSLGITQQFSLVKLGQAEYVEIAAINQATKLIKLEDVPEWIKTLQEIIKKDRRTS